ncbi:uncharacterized protein [Pyrus communis]|uniref:uncharacterized protein n=1 Tax=Pyrus communis TaxID=23211 RepID=UPI0035BF316B
MTALLAMMQKMAILVAESMLLDQEDTKAAKEVAKTMAIEAYSSAKKIKKLESELVALRGSNISAPISLKLETARQEIVDLKTKLDAIQVKNENAENEIGYYIPQIQDIKQLIVAYNQVIRFKKIVNRLKSQVLELQGALKINESLKKEVDELHRVRVNLLEDNKQLKNEKAGLEASLASISEIVREVSVWDGAAGDEVLDDATAESVAIAEGVATE